MTLAVEIENAAGSNTGESGRTYWLTGDESPCYRLRVARGPALPEPGTVSISALVDGIQVPFLEPEAETVIEVPVPAGAFEERRICADLSEIEDGHHVLSLAFRTDDQHIASSNVIYKNSWCFPDLPFTAFDRIRPAAHEAILVELLDRETGASLNDRVFPSKEGRLAIRLALGRAKWATEDLLVFALLDGRQLLLGRLGRRARFALPEPGLLGEVDFDFEGLPLDGSIHDLVIWSVHSFSSRAEDEFGYELQPRGGFMLNPVAAIWFQAGG